MYASSAPPAVTSTIVKNEKKIASHVFFHQSRRGPRGKPPESSSSFPIRHHATIDFTKSAVNSLGESVAL
jgi:hypothetical protein